MWRCLYHWSSASTRGQVLRSITVPLLWDTIQVAWVYLAILAILAIDGFAIVQIVTLGGPGNSSDVIGLRLYDTAMGESKFGYASAIGVATFFLTLSVILYLAFQRQVQSGLTAGHLK